MSVAHSVLPTYNAPLNKPAYQSSTNTTPIYSFNASLANDGNRETNAIKDDKPRCSISLNETNPWWAVDLGRPTTIYRVDLTNRGDSGVNVILFAVSKCSVILDLFIFYIVEVSNMIIFYRAMLAQSAVMR